MSLRRARHTPLVQIVPDLLHLYIPMEPALADDEVCNIELWIKRADGTTLPFSCDKPAPCCGAKRCNTGRCGCGRRDARWLLRYPAHDYQDGHIGFRFDTNLHRLPAGLYTAEIRDCGKACHRFEIEAPCCRQFGGSAETRLYHGECGDPDGFRDDVDPVFAAWYNYKTTTSRPIGPDDTLLRVALPTRPEAWEAPFPELVVSDGVAEEAMQVTFANGTTLGVKRTERNRFFEGACVRFVWTDANLEAAGYKNPNLIGCEDIFCCGTMPCDEGCD